MEVHLERKAAVSWLTPWRKLGTQMDLASVLAAEVSLIHTLAGSGLLRHVMVDFEPRNASKLINSKLSSSFEPRN